MSTVEGIQPIGRGGLQREGHRHRQREYERHIRQYDVSVVRGLYQRLQRVCDFQRTAVGEQAIEAQAASMKDHVV
jgi:hypothetical protein